VSIGLTTFLAYISYTRGYLTSAVGQAGCCCVAGLQALLVVMGVDPVVAATEYGHRWFGRWSI
jgi:hypothetical protein